MAKNAKPSNSGGAKGPFGSPRLTGPKHQKGSGGSSPKGQKPDTKFLQNTAKKVTGKGAKPLTPGKTMKPSSMATPKAQGKTGMRGPSAGGKK